MSSAGNFKTPIFFSALSFIHPATIFLFKRRFPGSSAFGFYRITDVRPLPTSATPSSSRPSILGQDNPGNAENEFVACPRVRVRVRVRADFVTRMSGVGGLKTCPFISEVLNGRFFTSRLLFHEILIVLRIRITTRLHLGSWKERKKKSIWLCRAWQWLINRFFFQSKIGSVFCK